MIKSDHLVSVLIDKETRQIAPLEIKMGDGVMRTIALNDIARMLNELLDKIEKQESIIDRFMEDDDPWEAER